MRDDSNDEHAVTNPRILGIDPGPLPKQSADSLYVGPHCKCSGVIPCKDPPHQYCSSILLINASVEEVLTITNK